MPQYTVQTNYGNKTVNADSPQQAQQIIQQGGQTVSNVYASTPAPEAGGSGVAAPAVDLLTATPEQTQQITQATMSPVASSTPGVVQPTTATPPPLVQTPTPLPNETGDAYFARTGQHFSEKFAEPEPLSKTPVQQTQAVIDDPYANLTNVNGTIYNSAGKGYATPEELAKDLGILPHQIDWSKIKAGTAPASTTVPAASTPSAPTAPAANQPPPIIPTTAYDRLLNEQGTIVDPSTGKRYSTPEELAQDLGIAPDKIDWSQIKQGNVATASYDQLINNNGQIENPSTGKKYSTPEELAKDLGVQPEQIQWDSIKDGQEPVNENSNTTVYDFAKDPVKAYTQLYTDMLKAAGVSTFKSEYEKLATSQAEEVSEEMNNPWLTESIKNARIKKINDKYEVKLGLYKTLYDQGIQEAKFITNGAYGAYADKTKADATALQNAASNALDLAKLQGGSEMTPDIKEYVFSVGQGYNGLLTDWQKEKYQATHAGSGGGDFDKLLSPSEAQALGVPYGTTRAGAFGVTPERPATAAQEKVASYASRIEQSLPIFERLTNDIVKMNPTQFEVMRNLPSYLQSSTFRQFDQAARNFINAKLREESGAVISPSEFDNAYKQYLPRARDDAETLKQKKLNRDIVFASFKRASGPAYQSIEDLFGGRPTVNTNNLIQQVDEDINDYASEYNYGGGREDLLKVLQESYPELSEEELANRVYTLIPSK